MVDDRDDTDCGECPFIDTLEEVDCVDTLESTTALEDRALDTGADLSDVFDSGAECVEDTGIDCDDKVDSGIDEVLAFLACKTQSKDPKLLLSCLKYLFTFIT